MEKIKKVIDRWSKTGMRWPFMHDPVKDKPSVTLLFFYVSFCIAAITIIISSIMMLIKNDPLIATFMPTILMFSGFAFYRMRRLDRFKVNLENKSIDLFSSAEEDLDK